MRLMRFASGLISSSLALAAPVAISAVLQPDMGKLLATSGVTQVEGAGGGGLTPWATITGYGTRDSFGANVHATAASTQDYSLDAQGIAVGLADRLELSLSRQTFRGEHAPLNNLEIRQDIVGVKLKMSGDLLYDQDRLLPQLAIGAMAKRNKGISGLGPVTHVGQLGAKRSSGIDYYVSATKLLLDRRVLMNGTIRATKANQMGLLGFGGDRRSDYQIVPEISVAYLFTRNLVGGVEYRSKPRNLSIDPEDDAYDVFLAYFVNKHLSMTAAFVDLGQITVFNQQRQRGGYLSLQAGF